MHCGIPSCPKSPLMIRRTAQVQIGSLEADLAVCFLRIWNSTWVSADAVSHVNKNTRKQEEERLLRNG